MAAGTGIRYVQLLSRSRRDESKRVATNVDVSDRLLDLRHMAGYALAAWRTDFMMSVLLDGHRARAVRRVAAVTL